MDGMRHIYLGPVSPLGFRCWWCNEGSGVNHMCDSSFHHSFESLRSFVVVEECESELVTVGMYAWLA